MYTEKKLEEVYKKFTERNELREATVEINQKIEKLSTQIANDLSNETQKVILLKNHARELHGLLGKDDTQSWFDTLCASEEWSQLTPFVKALMAAGPQKNKVAFKGGVMVHPSKNGQSAAAAANAEQMEKRKMHMNKKESQK